MAGEQAAIDRLEAEEDFLHDQLFEYRRIGNDIETSTLDAMNDRR